MARSLICINSHPRSRRRAIDSGRSITWKKLTAAPSRWQTHDGLRDWLDWSSLVHYGFAFQFRYGRLPPLHIDCSILAQRTTEGLFCWKKTNNKKEWICFTCFSPSFCAHANPKYMLSLDVRGRCLQILLREGKVHTLPTFAKKVESKWKKKCCQRPWKKKLTVEQSVCQASSIFIIQI